MVISVGMSDMEHRRRNVEIWNNVVRVRRHHDLAASEQGDASVWRISRWTERDIRSPHAHRYTRQTYLVHQTCLAIQHTSSTILLTSWRSRNPLPRIV